MSYSMQNVEPPTNFRFGSYPSFQFNSANQNYFNPIWTQPQLIQGKDYSHWYPINSDFADDPQLKSSLITQQNRISFDNDLNQAMNSGLKQSMQETGNKTLANNSGSGQMGAIVSLAGTAMNQLSEVVDAAKPQEFKANLNPLRARSYADLAKRSSFSGQIDAVKKLDNLEGGIDTFLKKPMEGAAAGAGLGPWGMLGGAIGGTVAGAAKWATEGAMFKKNKQHRAEVSEGLQRLDALDLSQNYRDINRSYTMNTNKLLASKFAEGGSMTSPLDNTTQINTGGTHEQNPYGGVQMGVGANGQPNLVEEGEVKYGNYVFSNRIQVKPDILKQLGYSNRYAKQGITYADLAKKVLAAHEETPNDPISKRSVEAIMNSLKEAQEYQKLEEEAAQYGMSPEEYQQAMVEQQQVQQMQQQQAMQQQGQMGQQEGYSEEEMAQIQQLAQQYGVSPEQVIQMLQEEQGAGMQEDPNNQQQMMGQAMPQEGMYSLGGYISNEMPSTLMNSYDNFLLQRARLRPRGNYFDGETGPSTMTQWNPYKDWDDFFKDNNYNPQSIPGLTIGNRFTDNSTQNKIGSDVLSWFNNLPEGSIFHALDRMKQNGSLNNNNFIEIIKSLYNNSNYQKNPLDDYILRSILNLSAAAKSTQDYAGYNKVSSQKEPYHIYLGLTDGKTGSLTTSFRPATYSQTQQQYNTVIPASANPDDTGGTPGNTIQEDTKTTPKDDQDEFGFADGDRYTTPWYKQFGIDLMRSTPIFNSALNVLEQDGPDYTYANDLERLYNPISYRPVGEHIFTRPMNPYEVYNMDQAQRNAMFARNRNVSGANPAMLNYYNALADRNFQGSVAKDMKQIADYNAEQDRARVQFNNAVDTANEQRRYQTEAANIQNRTSLYSQAAAAREQERLAVEEAKMHNREMLASNISSLGKELANKEMIKSNLLYDSYGNYMGNKGFQFPIYKGKKITNINDLIDIYNGNISDYTDDPDKENRFTDWYDESFNNMKNYYKHMYGSSWRKRQDREYNKRNK